MGTRPEGTCCPGLPSPAETALLGGLIVQAVRRRRAEAKERTRPRRCAPASIAFAISAPGCSARRRKSDRASRGNCTTTSASNDTALDRPGPAVANTPRDRRRGGAGPVAHGADAACRRLPAACVSCRMSSTRPSCVSSAWSAALDALQRKPQAAGHNVTFRHEQVPAVLPQEVMLCFYRIAQEALQNAIKHSGARAIAMSLTGRRTRADADRRRRRRGVRRGLRRGPGPRADQHGGAARALRRHAPHRFGAGAGHAPRGDGGRAAGRWPRRTTPKPRYASAISVAAAATGTASRT